LTNSSLSCFNRIRNHGAFGALQQARPFRQGKRLRRAVTRLLSS
jgi:hypothetical protein